MQEKTYETGTELAIAEILEMLFESQGDRPVTRKDLIEMSKYSRWVF